MRNIFMELSDNLDNKFLYIYIKSLNLIEIMEDLRANN